jgi:thiamine pyrophosphate-dependent acetolactate synthase large subunit-like protein
MLPRVTPNLEDRVMNSAEAVRHIAAQLDPSYLVVACNGMISRYLYAHEDHALRFYMIGSMGLASAIGLGLALAQPSRTVVVLDGDGNALMNLGTFGSVAAAGVQNFYHVLLDNHVHASTGGQKTISAVVPLHRVAHAAGYRQVRHVRSRAGVSRAVEALFSAPGPGMLVVDVDEANSPPSHVGRVEVAPDDLTSRFRQALLSRH